MKNTQIDKRVLRIREKIARLGGDTEKLEEEIRNLLESKDSERYDVQYLDSHGIKRNLRVLARDDQHARYELEYRLPSATVLSTRKVL